MTSRILSSIPLLLLQMVVPVASSASENYLYTVYYQDDSCNDVPASIIGIATEDDFSMYGGISTTGLCADESICRFNPDSPQCQSLNHTVTGDGSLSIQENGEIFLCDSSDTDGAQCSFFDGFACYSSSVYPSCHFIVLLSSDLVKTPETLKSTDTQHLEEYTYMVYYSDENCQQFEGMHAAISGENAMAVTDDSISCQDAMACVFDPNGNRCNELMGGQSATTSMIVTGTTNDGRDLVHCGDTSGNCDPVDPNECVASLLHPSCYVRWTTAARLYEDPASYIVDVRMSAAAANNGANENVGDESGAEDSTDYSGKDDESIAVCSMHLGNSVVGMIISFLVLQFGM